MLQWSSAHRKFHIQEYNFKTTTVGEQTYTITCFMFSSSEMWRQCCLKPWYLIINILRIVLNVVLLLFFLQYWRIFILSLTRESLVSSLYVFSWIFIMFRRHFQLRTNRFEFSIYKNTYHALNWRNQLFSHSSITKYSNTVSFLLTILFFSIFQLLLWHQTKRLNWTNLRTSEAQRPTLICFTFFNNNDKRLLISG